MTHPNNYKLAISLVIISLFLLLNFNVSESIYQYSFDDGTYSHAPLIILVVLYLLYDLFKNHEVAARQKVGWVPLGTASLCLYLMWVFTHSQINILIWGFVPIALLASLNTVFKLNFRLCFIVFFSFFLLPVWGILNVPLQNLSVIAVTIIMSLTSVPVYIHTTFVEIPSGTFEIAGGCSGLRYFITSLAISSLFSYLYLKRIKNTILFISCAILIALVTNWIRIAALIYIGHATEMQSGLMEDHNMFGWYIFVPAVFLLFKFGDKLIESERAPMISSNEEDGAETKKAHVKPSSINLTPVVVSIFLITVFSSQFKQLIAPGAVKGHYDDVPKEVSITPQVTHFSSVSVGEDGTNKTVLVYEFNGYDLDQKPTFYLDSLVPEGWNEKSRAIEGHAQQLTIRKGSREAIVTASYEINNHRVPTAGQFKKLRLKQAVSGHNQTKLNWSIKFVN